MLELYYHEKNKSSKIRHFSYYDEIRIIVIGLMARFNSNYRNVVVHRDGRKRKIHIYIIENHSEHTATVPHL